MSSFEDAQGLDMESEAAGQALESEKQTYEVSGGGGFV